MNKEIMIMKKCFLLLVGLLAGATLWAQTDDVYFVPKKSTKTKTSSETYYVGSDRDVDEYNRRGNYLVSAVEPLEEDDIIEFDAIRGQYPDTIYVEDPFYEDYADEDDYRYTRELYRWYDPWYYGWPYRSWWRWGWYDPWYAGYWGWYDPWYWGWSYSWYWPHYYGWGWGGRHHWNYSNRGHARAGHDLAGGGRRNVYNNIAKRSGTNSRRSVGNHRSYGNNSRGYSSNRSYSGSSTRSSGSYSGSRGGGFSGGGHSGGFGGGHSGGGGHGGRR